MFLCKSTPLLRPLFFFFWGGGGLKRGNSPVLLPPSLLSSLSQLSWTLHSQSSVRLQESAAPASEETGKPILSCCIDFCPYYEEAWGNCWSKNKINLSWRCMSVLCSAVFCCCQCCVPGKGFKRGRGEWGGGGGGGGGEYLLMCVCTYVCMGGWGALCVWGGVWGGVTVCLSCTIFCRYC